MIVSEMLPELLFSVGSSMQDFAKDELGLLGTGVVVGGEKDLLHLLPQTQQQQHQVQLQHQQQQQHHSIHQQHHHHHHQQQQQQPQHHLQGPGESGSAIGSTTDELKYAQTPDLIEVGDVSGKLDETDRDLYLWHSSSIGSKLLRSSDDPLISGGTNDNQNDNELSVATATQSMCSSPSTPPPPTSSKHRSSSIIVPTNLSPELPDTPVLPIPTPPLPTPAKTSGPGRRTNGTPRTRRKGPLKLRFHHQALPQEYLDHYEATQNNLQKRESQQQQQQQQHSQKQANGHSSRKNMMERQVNLEREERANESVRSWLQKIIELQKEGVSLAPVKDEMDTNGELALATPPVAATATGGSGTSNNKRIVNYTDLPYMGEITLDNSKPRRGRKPKKADICHLIYKNYGTILPGTPKREFDPEKVTPNGAKAAAKPAGSLLERRLTSSDERRKTSETPTENGKAKKDEPLNLCVRDVNGDALTLSSSDDDSDEVFNSSCPTPIITPTDVTIDQALAANMKIALPNLQSSSTSTETPSTGETPPGYMYWPNSAVFAHPMALYYQNAPDGHQGRAEQGPSKPSTNASSSSSPPSLSPVMSKPDYLPLLVPKHISQLVKHDKSADQPGPSPPTKHSPPTQKRKRSAIFIPPVPAENSSNPATEVSICKFKFTGGAKPCLQEKKILSVDSGGNFRYYSGTGDKSMRGYEFFPRESLQQSSINANSSTGAFLNAAGERIACDLPPPSLGLSNDILQIPEFPTPSLVAHSPLHYVATGSNHRTGTPLDTPATLDRRRRKSRRSSQRESLEKTFKEKGFLIQTQQLQSAEGATYCKFRQLRKFTRYLFRSWKDYLPGELQHGQQPAAAATTVATATADLGTTATLTAATDLTLDENPLLANGESRSPPPSSPGPSRSAIVSPSPVAPYSLHSEQLASDRRRLS